MSIDGLRVLISGAGIAGPTLAYWLARYGATPTIVERAPALRTGGYIIDFWGAGFEVAGRMGLVAELVRAGYMMEEVRAVDRTGRRVAGFPAAAFERATGGRYVSLPRGDLAAAIYRALGGSVETIFGDSVRRLEPRRDGVRVELASGAVREFDLVVGADGLHSRVRALAWGDEAQFERYMGIKVAAFETQGYRPRDELVYVMFTEVGQQVGRFSMRGDRTMFLFTFADPNGGGDGDIAAQKATLRRRFGQSGWECARILDALDEAPDLYFDRVSQVRLEPGGWAKDRVTLVGDAAWCVSLLAGQGSALAMTGAYVLAGELYRARGDYASAYRQYEARFAPFIRGKQDAARRFAGSFAPRSARSLWLRNRIMNLLAIPVVARLAVGREFADRIELPDY